MLVLVRWPAHESDASLLPLQLSAAGERRRLVKWCATQAPITTSSGMGTWIEFRRRRTVERVHALVVGESPG